MKNIMNYSAGFLEGVQMGKQQLMHSIGLQTIEVLKSFIEYCKKYPDQRFWQALRNWSNSDFIYIVDGKLGHMQDTFYFGERDK
jgi:hypothetical protein